MKFTSVSFNLGILSIITTITAFFIATLPLGLISIILGFIGCAANKNKNQANFILSVFSMTISFILLIARLIFNF